MHTLLGHTHAREGVVAPENEGRTPCLVVSLAELPVVSLAELYPVSMAEPGVVSLAGLPPVTFAELFVVSSAELHVLR